jgi:hypothetical protein
MKDDNVHELLLVLILMVVVGWFIVTSFIYSWTHPWKTPMQVLQHTPKTLVLDFDD